MKNPSHPGIGSRNNALMLVGSFAALLALAPPTARASTTIASGGTFTIDNTNTTVVGTTTTWNDTGTLTINNGGILQSWPSQNQSMINNDAIVFTGAAGTIALRYNGNDTDFMMNGSSITSTATGAQTLAILTGYNGNGDRESVTFNTGIPNATGGSTLGLNVTFRTQTGSTSWVNLPAVNTFTGPITLVQGSGPPVGTLTIGGKLTRNNGNTNGSGTLGGGNYPGAIALGTGTILNYASSAAQTLAGAISGAGALQVTGTGMLTLSGANTYTGNTTVSSGGKLTLGSTTGGLKFVITDAATNNKVTGAGTATMNGMFTLDTSAVTVNSGTWTLVNTTTKSFGSTFSVSGFNDADLDSIWTKLDGVRNWSFNEATGVLSVGTVAVFTSFGLPGNPAIIDNTAKTIQLFVPVGTSLATLAPVFTVSSGTCNQTSGAPPSPTFAVQNPATYTITDGAAVNSYSVSVQTYGTWAHSGSLFILTTPDGANIPVGDSATNFPLLVRLNNGNFNFGEAQPDGSDVRFITAAGSNLSYQIEQWDSVNSTAAVWVKIPSIAPNARQEIKMYWGKSGVASQSNGANVFNAANGYASVLHMNETVSDVVGNTAPTNSGTTLTTGMIGKGRNFTSGNGILVGTDLTNFPTGSNPHSSEVWIRSGVSPTTIMGWGIQQGQGKVVMQLASPPHINMDCYFGGANVTGASTLSTTQWVHVAHTYQNNTACIYVNGVLDGTITNGNTVMNMPTPARFYVGGWYDNYSFVGDMDEVRISNVTRSANWIKLEYENQKSLQTLVGSLVPAGDTFSASPSAVTMNEGATTTLSGQAGGAQKVYWIQRINGVDTVLATDQFTCTASAGRSTGGQSFDILFRAVYPAETKDIVIPVTVNEYLPDPVFTLTGPTTWDGRQTITITPNISNLAALQAAGVANLNYSWSVAGVAVTKTITAGTPTVPGVLTLTRSQGGGPMTVSLVLGNGGNLVSSSKTIIVQEPASDAWVQRTPGATEKAVNNQFYARDPNTNKGTIYYNGTGAGTTPVYLKVYTTDTGSDVPYGTPLRQTPVGGVYAFTVPIDAGKVTYKVEFGTTTGVVDNPASATATGLVCGDAYIIDGQSNALATDNTVAVDSTTSPWIRSYGKTVGWGNAINKSSEAELQLGVWGMILAKRLLANNNMPICIINGAIGGTRIDQHRPNPAGHSLPGSLYSIYANLYNRVVGANLTHGIRGVLWHQGEQDQGSGGPDGDYDYKFYQQYFVDISAAWKQDFPNIRNYYIFQIWPNACGDTSRNDQLREVQRTLPNLFSNMRIMSTVGIVPGSSCHYVLEGYQKFSDLIGPLVEQDHHGLSRTEVYSAANLQSVYFTTAARNEIALVFDQNMYWTDDSTYLFFLDGVSGKVGSGTVSGRTVKLQLSPVSAVSTASTITYLKGIGWDGLQAKLLRGANGIAALTFADVPIAATAPSPYAAWAADPAQGLTSGVNDGPLQDADLDGITNLLEFALGGVPMVSSQAILPVPAQDGANWVFEYDRSALSRPPDTTQIVEYGNDLTGWTSLTIPLASAGAVTITPGATTDHVKVVIPDLGARTFARLKVSQ
jgi:autotransporter-associated beta strand protein